MFQEREVKLQREHDKEIKEVGEIGTQNILDVASSKCKIIFPSTHVVYEGIDKIKTNIKEDEVTKPSVLYHTFLKSSK